MSPDLYPNSEDVVLSVLDSGTADFRLGDDASCELMFFVADSSLLLFTSLARLKLVCVPSNSDPELESVSTDRFDPLSWIPDADEEPSMRGWKN